MMEPKRLASKLRFCWAACAGEALIASEEDALEGGRLPPPWQCLAVTGVPCVALVVPALVVLSAG